MPAKRKYTKRRRYKKRQMIPKPIGGFAKSKLVKLKYAQEIIIAGTASGIVQHQFRCNSVFDPDYTGVGHQPMNFDRWAALYEHYTVMSSKCKVTPVGLSATNLIPGYMGIMVSTDSAGTTTLANVTSLFENNLSSHKKIQAGISSAYTRQVVVNGVTSYFNAKRLFGVVNPQDGAAYGALVTTNPARDAYYNVYLASINGNTPGNISFLVEIEYNVLFDELVSQTQN